jgi:hypothetical protein
VIVKKLSYLTVDKRDKDSPPLFGGRQTWKQREESFKLNATMKVIGCLHRGCMCFRSYYVTFLLITDEGVKVSKATTFFNSVDSH